jgi:outer membrane protein assembly factor BamB
MNRTTGRYVLPLIALVLQGTPLTAGAQAGQFNKVWEHSVAYRFNDLMVAGGGHLLAIGDEGLVGIDPATGRERWRVDRSGAQEILVAVTESSPLTAVLHRSDRPAAGAALAGSRSYMLSLYDASTGAGRWQTRYSAGDCIYISIRPDHDRLLVIVRDDDGIGVLFGLSLSSGQTVWRVDLGQVEERPYGTKVDPTRYFAAEEDRFYSVNRNAIPVAVEAHGIGDGSLRWMAFMEEETSPQLQLFGTSLLAQGDRFHCLDKNDGSIRWREDAAWRVVGEAGPWLLLSRMDGRRIQLMDEGRGETRWRGGARTSLAEPWAHSWIAAGLIVGTPNGRTEVFDQRNGERIERSRPRFDLTEGRELEWSFPHPSGIVFVYGSEQGTQVLLASEPQDPIWQTALGNLAEIGRGPVEYTGRRVFFTEGMGPRDAGSLWLIAQQAEGPALTRIDLATGAAAGSVPIGATDPLFVVDPGSRRLYFVDPGRMLVGVGY